MWHDNETKQDLVGYQEIATAIAELCGSSELLPLTIGLYGSWGSGKSSVLSMVYERLDATEGCVCVRFDGWQLEAYDDVRAALMSTVLDALEPHLPADAIPPVKLKVDWLRAAGLAVKGIAHFGALAATTGHVGTAGLVTAAETLADGASAVSLERGAPVAYTEQLAAAARGFREAFSQLVTDVGLSSVVVLIDDLDRCLPESVISILEAIKLFMAVDGTAFVLAVDDQVVGLAVAERFANAPNANEMSKNYLDKLIQVPVLLPPLSAADCEAFVYLLYAQAKLGPEDFEKLYARVVERRDDPSTGQSLNFGIAQEVLDSKALGVIESDFSVAQAAGPILARLADGNPRTIKRFLNTIELRLRLWPKSAGPPDKRLLAKLLLLERFHKDRFEELARWQTAGLGRSDEIMEIERLAKEGGPPEDQSQTKWLERSDLGQWLRSEPSLGDFNLTTYFNMARVVAVESLVEAQRLSPRQQAILAKLTSADRTTRQLGITELRSLGDSSAADEVVTLLEVNSVKNGVQSRELRALLDIGVALPAYAASATAVMEQLPRTDVTPVHVAQLGALAKAEPSVKEQVIQMLKELAAGGGRTGTAAEGIVRQLEEG